MNHDYKSCIDNCLSGYTSIHSICTKEGECPKGYKMSAYGECITPT
ncbi:MAG: hypothetical protein J6C50_00055 [Rickettsiales bacterium]|nr:hypothetical protein [Rickettsiales bacterium]